MLKRLKRKEVKAMNEQLNELKESIETLKEGACPLKEKTIALKQGLETEKALNFRLGYNKLQERLNYVLSYFQDYDQNILNAEKHIEAVKETKSDEDVSELINDFDTYIQELEEIQIELDDIEKELNKSTAKKSSKSSVLEFKEFGDMIGDAFKKAFVKDDSHNPNSKTSRLLKILPFLDEAEKSEIVEQILSDSDYFENVKLAPILPFLNQKDCDRIFLHEVEKDSKQLASIVPFVSQELLSEIVNKYINEEIDINMDMLYPFLTMADIKRLFFFELNQEN